MCISSEPSDIKAKVLAKNILQVALDNGVRGKWHTIIGGYKDELRDKVKPVNLLVLSNVPYNATDVKLEKLRDILELYHGVPRIVVTTGCEPIEFFNHLGLPLNYGLWIRSKRCIRVL
jgi:hypothetical protein